MRDIQVGIDLIKKWEGFRANAYRDPVGIWTIGYGTTRYPDGRAVRSGDTVSREQAEEYLQQWIDVNILDTLDDNVRVPLNTNQYSALVSFIYNVGGGAFRKSTLLKRVNAGDLNGAASEFDRWVHAGGKKLTGLVRRRAEEKALFLTPIQEPEQPPIKGDPTDPTVVPDVPEWFRNLIDFLAKLFGLGAK